MRSIIVNADDLGLCPSVNTAIFEVFRAGNLSSATFMVDMPGTADAVERLPEHPGLAVGLHFNLTEGWALTGPSSITWPDGRRPDRGTLVRWVYRGRVDPFDVRRECEAQLARMDELGLRPTHVDSHQHVHMVPPLFQAIGPVLEAHALPVRMVDPPRSAISDAAKRPRKALKQWINRRFAAIDRTRFAGPCNDALVSIFDLDHRGPYDAATYARLIEQVPEGELVEVMVHPYRLGDDVMGLYASEIERKRPFLERCAAEHAALSHTPVFGAMRLTTYGER